MDRGFQGAPSLLPPLVVGQQIRNGPYTVNVTESMVRQRERENLELERRWREEQRRRHIMDGQDEYFGEFKEFKIRRRFIRRVFSILTLQLIFTTLVIATFIYVEQAREIMFTHSYLWIVALTVFMFSFFSISCCECGRRQIPCNVINLILLTVSLAYLTATVSVFYSVESVLIAASATAFVTLVIFSIAACTDFDLTRQVGLILIVSLVGTLGIFAMIFTLYFTKIKALQVAIAIIGALLISMYLFFDIQTIMGGRSIELNPDEIVYATTQIYVDIVLLYRYILMLGGSFSH